jgi:hypothetical protein
MKFLIKAGCDIRIKNRWNHDPLQTLASSCPGKHRRSALGLFKLAEKERTKRLRQEDSPKTARTNFEFDI